MGIKEDKDDEDDQEDDEIGLIRKPSDKKSNYFTNVLRSDGIVANAAMTIVHFVIILAIPFLTPVISFLAISTMTYIQEGIFSKSIYFFDLYMANRLDPWWNNVPHLNIFFYLQSLAVLYMIVAFIELISYYLTGLENNGRFPVEYTIPKKILTFIFKALIGIHALLYFTMVWFVLVWAVLAAIINPSRFLPYAAAALTFFTTITVKIIYY